MLHRNSSSDGSSHKRLAKKVSCSRASIRLSPNVKTPLSANLKGVNLCGNLLFSITDSTAMLVNMNIPQYMKFLNNSRGLQSNLSRRTSIHSRRYRRNVAAVCMSHSLIYCNAFMHLFFANLPKLSVIVSNDSSNLNFIVISRTNQTNTA